MGKIRWSSNLKCESNNLDKNSIKTAFEKFSEFCYNF